MADLSRTEQEQQDDGGWIFDWLGWSPGQVVECGGMVTVRALTTLVGTRADRAAGARSQGAEAFQVPA